MKHFEAFLCNPAWITHEGLRRMGHQLSRYGPRSLSMGIYIDMARLSKYGRNIWNIFIDPYTLKPYTVSVIPTLYSFSEDGAERGSSQDRHAKY